MRLFAPRACVSLLAVVLALAGCASTRGPGQTFDPTQRPQEPDAAPVPLPAIADVAQQYNQRVADLDRLRTPLTVLLNLPPDQPGASRRREQVEGNLQVFQPERVSLRLDKVGQTLLVMGAGEGRYWWIQMGDQPQAFAGELARASFAKAQRLGVPIHPLDVLELLGIVPLTGKESLAWDRGFLRVSGRSRFGSRVLFLDPASLEPRAIWLRDARGLVAVWAELSRPVPVPVDGKPFSPARIPSRITARVPDADTDIELALTKPENPGERLRTRQFEIASVLAAYGSPEVIDIDQRWQDADTPRPTLRPLPAPRLPASGVGADSEGPSSANPRP